MTAKQFLEENTFGKQVYPIYSSEAVIEFMEAFARKKCQEQREICHKRVVDFWSKNNQAVMSDYVGLIKNAPEPKLR